jgi:hypothetical protein
MIPHGPFRRVLIALIGTCFLAIGAQPQSVSSSATASAGAPEDAFISPEKYTNAFFGFALPIPQGGQFQQFTPALQDHSRHMLFGLLSFSSRLSTLLVTANEPNGSPEDVKRAASGPTGQSTKPVTIAGKQFWKSESEQKNSAGKLRSVDYATQLKGYVVVFRIAAFDPKLADELEGAVESLTFFDPPKAKDVAGLDSRPYYPSGLRSRNAGVFSPSQRIANLSLGGVSRNVYSNDELGFTYEFPADWHVADKATEDKVIAAGHEVAWGNDPAARREHEQMEQCTRILLYVTKYPEGSSPEAVNPGVMIMAFDSRCSPDAPQFPTSTDDEEGISRVGAAMLQSLARTPFTPSKRNSIRVLSAQDHLLLEIPGAFAVNVPGRTLPVDSSTSMVFTSLNDYWISFMFMSGSEPGVKELVSSAKIAFTARTLVPRGK